MEFKVLGTIFKSRFEEDYNPALGARRINTVAVIKERSSARKLPLIYLSLFLPGQLHSHDLYIAGSSNQNEDLGHSEQHMFLDQHPICLCSWQKNLLSQYAWPKRQDSLVQSDLPGNHNVIILGLASLRWRGRFINRL